MTRILYIETSTKTCSIALAENTKVLALKETHNVYTHAENITLFVESVVKTSGYKLSDIHAVCVSRGPGSYMGLRIGTATAKGFCFAFDIPLIAVDTLQAMAHKASGMTNIKNALFCPMIDARRMEVYCGLYDFNNAVISPPEALIIDENAFKDTLKTSPIYFFGDGASKCENILRSYENAHFLSDYNMSADAMISLGFAKYGEKIFEDLAYFEPFYLKDFIPGLAKVKGLN